MAFPSSPINDFTYCTFLQMEDLKRTNQAIKGKLKAYEVQIEKMKEDKNQQIIVSFCQYQ